MKIDCTRTLHAKFSILIHDFLCCSLTTRAHNVCSYINKEHSQIVDWVLVFFFYFGINLTHKTTSFTHFICAWFERRQTALFFCVCVGCLERRTKRIACIQSNQAKCVSFGVSVSSKMCVKHALESSKFYNRVSWFFGWSQQFSWATAVSAIRCNFYM